MSDGTKFKLAYYSSIPCEPSFGGPLQIYRHFRERQDFDFIDLNERKENLWPDWIGRGPASSKVFQRLSNTRLHPWLLSRAYTTRLGLEAEHLGERIRASGADAVVTVAYGRRCYVARDAAKLLGLPLITVYHDWWPDLVFAKTARTLAYLDRNFRKLAHDSDLVLSVSQPLLDELGVTTQGVVLPPIPAERLADDTLLEAASGDTPGKTLVYAGTLEGRYGAMVRALGMELLHQAGQSWTLRAYGPATDWPSDERHALDASGIYGGTLSQGPQLQGALAAADALLVVMDFEVESRRRVKTSFPSKILDYAQIGRPIVAWGPEECFASRFAREHELGWVVNETAPRAVPAVLAGGWPAAQAAEFSQAMRALCEGSHSADAIHRTLCQSVTSLLLSRRT